MKVLDLCSGLNGFSQAAVDAHHVVVQIDNNPDLPSTHKVDARLIARDPKRWLDENVGVGWRPDMVLAGPPCQGFSVASMGKMWHKEGEVYVPKHRTSKLGLEILDAVLRIIEVLEPKWWLVENPVGMMRKVMAWKYGLEPLANVQFPRSVKGNEKKPSTSYCQYGESYRKPEDLWGVPPPGFQPRAPCQAKPKFGLVEDREGRVWVCTPDGKPCHESAPRGSRTGVQGVKGSQERAVIPYELSISVMSAACAAMKEQFSFLKPEPEVSLEVFA